MSMPPALLIGLELCLEHMSPALIIGLELCLEHMPPALIIGLELCLEHMPPALLIGLELAEESDGRASTASQLFGYARRLRSVRPALLMALLY